MTRYELFTAVLDRFNTAKVEAGWHPVLMEGTVAELFEFIEEELPKVTPDPKPKYKVHGQTSFLYCPICKGGCLDANEHDPGSATDQEADYL